MGWRIGLTIAWLMLVPLAANAGEADVVDVKVRKTGANTYAFEVTVRHDDTGWKHYADKWEVVGPDGNVLGTRTLLHPHENEQPFTRSLSGVRIPASVKQVTVRASDKVHALGGATKIVALPQ
jgi:hypothetical protein